jgi:hypothetical protein
MSLWVEYHDSNYKVFTEKTDFFGGDGLYRAKSKKDMETFLRGYAKGFSAGMEQTSNLCLAEISIRTQILSECENAKC